MSILDYYPSVWDRAPLVLGGAVVIVLALVTLALIIARRDALATRTQALAGGLCIALAWALVCGNAFLYVQSRTDGPNFFLAPVDVRAGLLLGIGSGALALLAVGAFVALRRASIVGLLLGAALALALFRLIFGPTAGFGGEVGYGVGQEVGVMFGVAGGLLGGVIGSVTTAIAASMRRADGQQPTTARGGRRLLVGLAGLVMGGVAGVLVGVVGVNAGVFQFLVPYNAQVPDVPPDTSPAGLQRDFLFGLGLFVIGGALIGCFLALQWTPSDKTGARRHGVWLGVGLALALICGLTFGLDHRFVGGPFLAHLPFPTDPAASVRGLLIGLGVGALLGALLLILARAGRSHGCWRAASSTILALAIGLLLVTLPYWYTPIFAINIP
jgi:hypothetical protein